MPSRITSGEYLLNIEEMHCASCELYIEGRLRDLPYVKDIKATSKTGEVRLVLDCPISQDLVSEMNNKIKDGGYTIGERKIHKRANYTDYLIALFLSLCILSIFMLIGDIDFATISGGSGLTARFVFFLGFVASLSSCAAVVGSLVLTMTVNYVKNGVSKFFPILIFHTSRVISFAVLGAILGALGNVVAFSVGVTALLAGILYILMLVMALNMLEVSVLRNLNVRFPAPLYRVFSARVLPSPFLPIFVGLITFFLPCGFTQSMQFAALASGSAARGAEIMVMFALGTFPILFLISFAAFNISKTYFARIFYKMSGLLVLYFSVLGLLGTARVLGLIS